jgi:hypothetical protein
MASWSDFNAADPTLAAATRALFEQYGPGLAYLATVRRDGAPRLHPVSPVFTDEGLYCFIVASPKRGDLARDGRYALHSFPPEESDDEAYLTGRATRVHDPVVIGTLSQTWRASPAVDWHLYELEIDTATLRRHGPGGALPLAATPTTHPLSRTWRARLSRPLAIAS